jgi:hypothetical protein
MDLGPLHFDSSLTPEQNIELFFAYMEILDAHRTKLLKNNIGMMLPLQPDPARSAQRTKFMNEILKDLDIDS